MTDEPQASELPPVTLRPELAERFLTAMQAAAVEEGGMAGLEEALRRLRPAPVAAWRHQSWLAALQQTTTYRRIRVRWGGLYRWGAAALLVLCTAGAFLVVTGASSVAAPAGLACRSVVDSHARDDVQWSEGLVALRSCDVLYEDSFVLDGEDDCTITVRVPVRSRVMIEEEVI